MVFKVIKTLKRCELIYVSDIADGYFKEWHLFFGIKISLHSVLYLILQSACDLSISGHLINASDFFKIVVLEC